MVRNPIDCIASLKERFWNLEKDNPKFSAIDYAIDRWLLDTNAALAASKKGNAYLVHFEDFLARPSEIIRGITNFIGIEYSDECLADGSAYDVNTSFIPDNMALRIKQTSKLILSSSPSRVGCFTDFEYKKIFAQTHNLARDLQYEEEFDSAIHRTRYVRKTTVE
jgi:hypothetical protein